MKKKIVIVIVFSVLLQSKVTSQATNKDYKQSKYDLKELLWSSIQSTLEYTDSKGNIDRFITVIEDVKNGYLKVSGEFPPCGCPISETVAAFKDTKGNYTFLEEETEGCNWKYQLSSNTNLTAILPENFGIKTFIPTLKNNVTEQAFFYLEIDIPRHGTETKVRLKVIPIGMQVKSTNLLVYTISEDTEKTRLTNLKSWHQLILDLSEEGINLIYKNKCKNLSKNNQEKLQKYLQKNNEASIKTFHKNLVKIKEIYDFYCQIKHKSILLKWDKTTTRFYIKERGDEVKPMSFQQFLRSDILTYWSPQC